MCVCVYVFVHVRVCAHVNMGHASEMRVSLCIREWCVCVCVTKIKREQ